MKKRKIICLGSHVDKKKGFVSGLSMMHELFISIVKEKGYIVKTVAINKYSSKTDGQIGNPGIKRYFDYISIFLKLIYVFAVNRQCIFYFNPSTAKMGFYRDVLAVSMAKFFGHKVLMQQFGALFGVFKEGLGEKSQRLLVKTYNKADLIIVEGEHAKNQYDFIDNPQKIKVVQNGLPEQSKGIIKVVKNYNSFSSFNLFFMNNMIESKGYVDVLKAVDILVNEKNRNVTCTFAGRYMRIQSDEYFKSKEEARDWFDSFVKEKKLSERVYYFDCVFDEKKEEQFKKAHAFMLPSYYPFEGQPTAVLEALSYGCVPIVTNYRLIPDMVNDNCGVFVDSKSPDSIVKAVEFLMDNPRRYEELSQNSINRFKQNFTQDAYAKKILKEIESLEKSYI